MNGYLHVKPLCSVPYITCNNNNSAYIIIIHNATLEKDSSYILSPLHLHITSYNKQPGQ